MIEPHQRGLDPNVQAEWERRVGGPEPTPDGEEPDMLPDGGLRAQQHATDEFLARIGDADRLEDPLAGVETHGGYWGFDVPEGYHDD